MLKSQASGGKFVGYFQGTDLGLSNQGAGGSVWECSQSREQLFYLGKIKAFSVACV